jgi:hypothetical protein
VSNQPEGNLVEHFQQHESTGWLGTALWQSDVRPPLDTNVGISTRLALSISTLLDNTFIFLGLYCFVV